MTMKNNYMLLIYVLLLFVFVKWAYLMPVDPKQKLYEDGYLESMDADEAVVREAVKKYQNAYGLPAHGNMDMYTMTKMSIPHCGMAPEDMQKMPLTSVWKNHNLTFKIRNSTDVFTEPQARKAFENAIKWWTQNVNLNISEGHSDLADIDVYLNYQDGRYNVLGYAFFPTNGDIYFDKDEPWTFTNSQKHLNKINANWVVAHEMGHALGLPHVNSTGSIMHPFYSTEVWKPSTIDTNNLRYLYGGKNSLDNHLFCKKTVVDAMLHSTTGELMLIKGKYFWLFQDTLQSGPYSLDIVFPDLPEKIDAAMTVKHTTYIFKDGAFYKYKASSRTSKKKRMSMFFDNLVTHIDAAFFDPEYNICYFFKGERYYEFDTSETALVVKGKKIFKSWNGLPNNVEAATYLGNHTVLFIKNSHCYTVDLHTKQMLQSQDCRTAFYKC